jgi:ribosomal RNA assembly protein
LIFFVRFARRKPPKDATQKKSKSPFPPAPTPSKIDLQLESGEYFLNERQRKQIKLNEKKMKAAENSSMKKVEKRKDFEAPQEEAYVRSVESVAVFVHLFL